MQRRRRRTNQSTSVQFMRVAVGKLRQGLTKMRIPSASFCQRSIFSSSSSFAIFEYKEKIGPELSPKLDSPCIGRNDGCFCADQAFSRWTSTYTLMNLRKSGHATAEIPVAVRAALPFSSSLVLCFSSGSAWDRDIGL